MKCYQESRGVCSGPVRIHGNLPRCEHHARVFDELRATRDWHCGDRAFSTDIPDYQSPDSYWGPEQKELRRRGIATSFYTDG